MERVENSDTIPIDLIVHILSRTPAKSVARFRCVSKLWSSMLHRPYFTELFLTRSQARPRLFFAIRGCSRWSFYSSPQNPYENSLRFHINVDESQFCGLTSGLIYFSDVGKAMQGEYTRRVPVICNPNTRQYVILPNLNRYKKSYSYLTFDPIGKQYKVLFMAHPSSDDDHRILTLGAGELTWRTIQCPIRHEPYQKNCRKEICINGVLYYFATKLDEEYLKIVCFDVRSETFKFIETECGCYYDLINYKGKLGRVGFCWSLDEYDDDGIDRSRLSVWVLQDVQKQEWLKYEYILCDKHDLLGCNDYYVVGMTAAGDIVFAEQYTENPFYVYYFSPERNTLQRVEIQGLAQKFSSCGVYAFVDHVEDLNAYDVKQLKSGPDLGMLAPPPPSVVR